jgi:hypothetical protein
VLIIFLAFFHADIRVTGFAEFDEFAPGERLYCQVPGDVSNASKTRSVEMTFVKSNVCSTVFACALPARNPAACPAATRIRVLMSSVPA